MQPTEQGVRGKIKLSLRLAQAKGDRFPVKVVNFLIERR
jgi:hypothetical protein